MPHYSYRPRFRRTPQGPIGPDLSSKYLTRKDAGVGEGEYDSIAWALEVHAGLPDTGEYRAAMLHGNEDDPERIEFWSKDEPKITDEPDFVWKR